MKRAVIGIDLGGTQIKAGIVDESGVVLHRVSIPTLAEEGRDALLQRLINLINGCMQWCGEAGWEPAAIGIGTAGYVNPLSGQVAYATGNLPGWTGMALRDSISSACGLPAAVMNDAHAMALGEAWLGAGQSYKDFLCITLGTGIGGSYVKDGFPVNGSSGFAGGFGHMKIALNGLPCNCGGTGCWERYASVNALMKQCVEFGMDPALIPQGAKDLFALARSGNTIAEDIIEEFARYVAVGITNLLYAFNPEAVIIGGAIAAQGDFLLHRMKRYIDHSAIPVYRSTPLLTAQLGNEAGVIGAAKMALTLLS